MSRSKTDCEGVYLRKSARRLLSDGTPDQGYDIAYRRDGKLVWEKVGWVSEGYTLEAAVQRRLERLEQKPNPSCAANVPTIDELWEHYRQNAPRLPRPATYTYIARRLPMYGLATSPLRIWTIFVRSLAQR